MKKSFTLALALLTAGSVVAAETSPADTVGGALAKLNAATNYSWTVTLQLPQFEPGPVKGRTERGGYTMASQEFNDNTTEVVFKGDKAAVKGEEGWQNLDEAQGPAAMMGGWLVAYGNAADEASKMLKGVKELKNGDNVFSGDLTPEAAKELMTFKPRRGQAPPPPPKDAKGSVKFWVKDGALTKFESHLQATVSFGPDQDPQPFEVTRTVEIQNVGTTKVDVPEDAKKKLESK